MAVHFSTGTSIRRSLPIITLLNDDRKVIIKTQRNIYRIQYPTAGFGLFALALSLSPQCADGCRGIFLLPRCHRRRVGSFQRSTLEPHNTPQCIAPQSFVKKMENTSSSETYSTPVPQSFVPKSGRNVSPRSTPAVRVTPCLIERYALFDSFYRGLNDCSGASFGAESGVNPRLRSGNSCIPKPKNMRGGGT